MIASVFTRSLTARLAVLFGLVSAAAMALAALLIDRALTAEFVRRDLTELRGKAALALHLVDEFGAARLAGAERHRLEDLVAGHPRLRVAIFTEAVGPTLVGNGDASEDARRVAMDALQVRSRAAEGVVVNETPDGAWRYVVAWNDGDPRAVALAEVATAELHAMHAAIRRTLALAAGLALALAVAGGLLVARRGLAPLERISDAARAVSAQRLSTRLPTSNLPYEVVPLAESFNAMLARLEDAFTRMADFSADLAHELRTPVQNLILQNSVAQQQLRAPHEYQELLESNLEELRRLARMTEQMLFIARAEHDRHALRREALDLGDEARSVVEFYALQADERGMRIEVEGRAPGRWDRDLVRRAIGNLLSNAIRYGAESSTIQVRVLGHAGAGQVDVQNEGPGITLEHQPRVFDRFFRTDAARSASERGAGLGLAIVATIARLHGGSVSLVSSPAGPTRFTLLLPHASE